MAIRQIRQLLKRCIPSFVAMHRLPNPSQLLLTFDDGPDPEVTPRVLDILERYEARGLFFVPGLRIPRAPHLLREIVARGHGLGNHGYSHQPLPTLSWSAQLRDLEAGREAIFDATGVRPRFMRPPHGAVDLRVLAAAWRTGHRIMLWSATTMEYDRLRGAASSVLARALLDQTLRGAIVLSHDDHAAIADTMEQALPVAHTAGLDMAGALTDLAWYDGPHPAVSCALDATVTDST